MTLLEHITRLKAQHNKNSAWLQSAALTLAHGRAVLTNVVPQGVEQPTAAQHAQQAGLRLSGYGWTAKSGFWISYEINGTQKRS